MIKKNSREFNQHFILSWFFLLPVWRILFHFISFDFYSYSYYFSTLKFIFIFTFLMVLRLQVQTPSSSRRTSLAYKVACEYVMAILNKACEDRIKWWTRRGLSIGMSLSSCLPSLLLPFSSLLSLCVSLFFYGVRFSAS